MFVDLFLCMLFAYMFVWLFACLTVCLLVWLLIVGVCALLACYACLLVRSFVSWLFDLYVCVRACSLALVVCLFVC